MRINIVLELGVGRGLQEKITTLPGFLSRVELHFSGSELPFPVPYLLSYLEWNSSSVTSSLFNLRAKTLTLIFESLPT